MDHLNSFDGTPIAYLDAGDGRPSSSRTASLLTTVSTGFSRASWTHWWPRDDACWHPTHAVMGPRQAHDPDAYGGDAMVRDIQSLLDAWASTPSTWSATRWVRSCPPGWCPWSRGPVHSSSAVWADGLGATDDRRTVRRSPTHSKPTTPAPSVTRAPGAFRAFADATGADRMALAAIQRAPLGEPAALDRIAVPTMVLTGDADTLVGPPRCARCPDPRGDRKDPRRRSPERGQRPGVRPLDRGLHRGRLGELIVRTFTPWFSHHRGPRG